MIANLTIFTIINTIMILMAASIRLRKTFVCWSAKVYPKQPEVSQDSMVNTVYSTNLRQKFDKNTLQL
jgi:hypothetical protein